LKKALHTQRAVKQCCGVDLWDALGYDPELYASGHNREDRGKDEVERIRSDLIKNKGQNKEGHGVRIGPHKEICDALLEVLDIREKYRETRKMGIEGEDDDGSGTVLALPSDSTANDLRKVWSIAKNPDVAAFCRVRLGLLESKYNVWSLESRDKEMVEQQGLGGDFLTVPKVDTHLHNSAMMTPKQLSSYMHKIYQRDKERVHFVKDGKEVTVGETMLENGFTPDKSQMDKLQGNHNMFANFANFNKGFTPLGSRALKKLFLGTEDMEGEVSEDRARCNGCGGPNNSLTLIPSQYLFDLTKQCAEIARDEAEAFLEARFSVYGNNLSGWSALAKWYRRWEIDKSISSTLLAVQLPRVYPIWRKLGMVGSFGEMLSNFFEPLFQAAREPPDSGSDMAYILPKLRMLDSVDDESKEDSFDISGLPPPNEWTSTTNPPWSYYHHYMHVNVAKLNRLTQRSLNPIQVRPHAGEAGPTHHLAAAFLFCDGISHGINLALEPVLEYLYYLAQVPIGVSPISNSVLFLKYRDNPFPTFFKRGLCVALTTDDPLMFHSTPTPLLEEYATAKHSFDLSSIDVCEIARYSCLAAFSEGELKDMYNRGVKGEDQPDKTNIPKMRLDYRRERLEEEWKELKG
jgi:AMP deaminase